MHFCPEGKNRGFAPSSRRTQQATGLLHLDRFESLTYHNIKNPTTDVVGFFMAFMNLMYIFQQFIDDIKTKRV